jgi:hypothetical protein
MVPRGVPETLPRTNLFVIGRPPKAWQTTGWAVGFTGIGDLSGGARLRKAIKVKVGNATNF